MTGDGARETKMVECHFHDTSNAIFVDVLHGKACDAHILEDDSFGCRGTAHEGKDSTTERGAEGRECTQGTYHSRVSVMAGLVYGVATISRRLKIIGLFCKRALQKETIFCKRDL